MNIFMKRFIILIVLLFLSIPARASHPVSEDVLNHIKVTGSSDIRDVQNFPPSRLPDGIKSLFIITMPDDRTKIILTGRGKDGIFRSFGRMEQAGKCKDAIFVLTYVLKLSPDRTPAYLNLADALYKDGKEAKKYYKTYVDLMNKEGKDIPSRVYDRL